MPLRTSPAQSAPADDPEGKRWDARIDDAVAKWDRERDWREKYVKLFKDGRFPGAEDDAASGANVNLCFSYVSLVTALLSGNPAVIQVDPKGEGVDELFAQALEEWLTYSYEETDGPTVQEVTIFDALLRGIAWTKESYDPETGLDVADALTCLEVYVDPIARYSQKQARFILQECTKPIDEARKFFNRDDLEPNFKLADWQKGLTYQRSADTKQSNDKDLIRFYEIWERGADGSRNLSYRLHKERTWIDRGPWPFTLDSDEFPYSACVFNTQHEGLDGFSEQQIVDALQREVNELFEFDRRTTRRGCAPKVIYRKDAFDEQDVENRLASPKSMQFLGVKAGIPLNDAVKVLQLDADTREQKEVYGRAKAMHDEVLGFDELLRGATSNEMTKAEAEIREGVSMTRLEARQGKVDKWLVRSTRHRAQIARQLVDPQLVARVVAPEKAQAFVQYAGEAKDLVREFSIGVRAGSTGKNARKRDVDEARETYEIAEHTNMTLVSFGLPPMYDLAAISMDLMESRRIRNPKRFLLPPPAPMQMAVDPMTGQPVAQDPAMAMQGQPQMQGAMPAGVLV